jgi:hypothetical protein
MTTMAEATLKSDGSRLLLEVYAAPRAARSRVAGLHDGRLKVHLAAPPVDGAANEELVRFLARELGLPRSAVSLERGASSRRKTVAIEGLDAAEARGRLGIAPQG